MAMTNDIGNCLECGAPATYLIDLATGRMMYNDIDNGQLARLCEEHKPAEWALGQPMNSTHVWFRWGGIVDTHEQAKRQMRNEKKRMATPDDLQLDEWQEMRQDLELMQARFQNYRLILEDRIKTLSYPLDITATHIIQNLTAMDLLFTNVVMALRILHKDFADRVDERDQETEKNASDKSTSQRLFEERNAKAYAEHDDRLCMLCGARGDDKRSLLISCFYNIHEVVPEAINVQGVSELNENGFKVGYYVRICKYCRGDLLDRLKAWRKESAGREAWAKDHDGYPFEGEE